MKRNQTYHQTFFVNVKKNVPWHILAPSAVACDMFLLRASAHHWHVSAFLCNREFQGIFYYTKKHRKVFIFTVLFFLIICRIIFVLTAPLASPLRCLLPFHPPQSLPD